MAKSSPIQSNFNSGEFSPLLFGRVDADRYKTGLAKCVNYVPIVQGPVTNRPGNRYVGDVKTSSDFCRIVPFEFSVTQAYVIEFGDLYIRFYKDNAQILDGGSPVEVVTPYLTADLATLKFSQSADTLYITATGYAPRKLTRTSDIAWTLTEIKTVNGPYLDTNTTTTTLTPGAATGTTSLTASSTVGINGGDGFKSTDVGRVVRFFQSSIWGWARIVTFNSTTLVQIEIFITFSTTSANDVWRLGVWSDTTGHPATSTFHEDRLYMAGPTDNPQRIDGSTVGDYENFRPTDNTGSVADTDAVSFTLNALKVNAIRWIDSEEKALQVGTVGGEWSVRPSSVSEPITPTNVSAKLSTGYGSADIQPIKLGKGNLFVQRAARKVRDLIYAFEVDGFRSSELSILAEHVMESGVTEVQYQKEPYSVVWLVRNDGVLVAMSYERDTESLKVGFSRHIIGGVSDAAGTDAKVESIAVIPSADGSYDEIWMIVQRYIDGASVRQVEYATKFFREEDKLVDAFFVDSGLTLDNPVTVTGITEANPGVVTAASHGFSNGDIIKHVKVKGMTEVNEETYKVANKTANTYELNDEDDNNIDTSSFTTYISGGEVRKFVTAISGLTHLEGEVVTILADGSVQPDKTVASGAITLSTRATIVHVGLGYNCDIQLLRTEAGAADGAALGKKRRIHRLHLLLNRSVGLQVGTDFTNMDKVQFRKASDPLSRPVPLFTGLKEITPRANWDKENQIAIRQSQPLPSTILALTMQMATQDR